MAPVFVPPESGVVILAGVVIIPPLGEVEVDVGPVVVVDVMGEPSACSTW